jgi:cell division protein FtsI/penicillin-binding protein 2/cell division protein FtsW (lipid II flippase)/DNA uptake protein ComE-like DNA-binding protein
MARDRSRATEGSLLFFVLLILAAGFLLVFLAKTREGIPTDAVNLNTATQEELAVTLEIDPELAERLVKHRQKLGGFDHVQRLSSLPVFVTKDETDTARAAMQQGHIDPNTESVDGLERRLQITRPVARRIVAYRDALPTGQFKHPEDLLRVPIVDDRTLTSLGSHLIVRHPMQVFLQFMWWGVILFALIIAAPIVLRKSGVGGDPYLLPLAFFLAGVGVIMLFSIKDPLRDMDVYAHHIKGIIAGIAVLLVGALLSSRTRRNLRKYSYVWALGAVGLLLLLRLFGGGPEGVRLSMFGIQPVEIIKILLILFVAGYLAERGDLLAEALHRWRPPMLKGRLAKIGIAWPRWQDAGPIIGMYSVALILFLVVKDMGPALVLFGAFIATMYIATGRSGILLIGLLMMFLGQASAYYLRVGVIPVRVEMWHAPWANSHPNGMQLGQSLWGMASGGIWGSGLGLGSPREMPRSGSDLVFASIAEETGFIGAMVILICFVALVQRGLKIALKTQNDFDRILALGLTTLLASQVFFIVAGVTGLLPLTGITLPFVAYGNSSLVAGFFLIGLLRGISAPTGSVAVGPTKPMFQRTVNQFALAMGILLLGFVGLGRLFVVQVIQSNDLAGRAIRTPDADKAVRAKLNPRLLAIERSIQRGSIYDRKGAVLATSRLDEISHAIGDNSPLARKFFRKGRYYPQGAEFAHLIGYLDPSLGGPAGMEREFNHDLRGFDTYSELLHDYRMKDLPFRAHRQGSDVVLTLDAEMQHQAVQILKERTAALIDSTTGKHKNRAAMVVLDPLSGETLVSAAIPSYDPNTLAPASWKTLSADADQAHKLLDRSRSGYYPPGSTMKIATAGAGMEDGTEPDYDCNHIAKDLRWTYGNSVFGRRQLLDDKGDPPHDHIKLAGAVQVSCNLYFANLGIKLGADKLYHAFADKDRWAFSRVKSLPLFAAELPTNAFGQGNMVATPTEMAHVAASVANRGSMMQSIYWKEVKDPTGKAGRKNIPTVMSRPLSAENAGRLSEMMRSVVTKGTARGVFDDLPVEVAGKTGTAQTDAGDKEPHSWFIGFTPVSKPQYAFACVIENGGYGKRGAAPAIRSFLDTIYKR